MDIKTFFKAFRHRSLADELEIEKLEAERDIWKNTAEHWGPKYKQAVADLEKQAGEIAALKRDYARRGELIQEARNERDRAEAEAKSLRPDALAMRRKRQMDRDRRKGR